MEIMKLHSLNIVLIILMFCPFTDRAATLEMNNYKYTSGRFEDTSIGLGVHEVNQVQLRFWTPDSSCRITRAQSTEFCIKTSDEWQCYETPAWSSDAFVKKGNYLSSPLMTIPYIHTIENVQLYWMDSGGAFELQCSREQQGLYGILEATSTSESLLFSVSTGRIFSSTKDSLIIEVKDEVELSVAKSSAQLLTGNKADLSKYITITQGGIKTNKFVLTSNSGKTTMIEYSPSTGKVFWKDNNNLPAGEYKGEIIVSIHFP